MKDNTYAIRANLSPLVEKSMKTNVKKFDALMSKFLNDRHEQLFSILPTERIFYSEEDKNLLIDTIGIPESMIKNVIANTYYGNIASFYPRAAKDSVTVLMMTLIRYFIQKKDAKRLDLAIVYLAFSGKFYPSIHYGSFPKVVPKDYVMDYVVNNMMNNKFDLKSKGSIFAAILSKAQVWVETYNDKFGSFDDDDVVYLIQQLHIRIKLFIQNIATLYYKAYENKDYIVYNSDSEDTEDPTEYHLANNDLFVATKAVDTTMTFIVRNNVDYRICKLSSNQYVKTEEVKSIITTIINDKENLPLIKRVISVVVYSYFASHKEKTVVSSDFITYGISAKPNIQDKNWIEVKQIVEKWLSTGSAAYRRRCKRIATKLAYNKSVMSYFVLAIYAANK